MSMTAIRAAFRSKLLTVSGLPPVAWQNRTFTPPNQAVWFKESLLPATSALTSFCGVGVDGLIQETGIYQITVYTPVGTETKAADDWASLLAATFKPGVVLSHSGQQVRCESAAIAPPVQETSWFGVPVSIRYRLFRSNL
jgi:hypothetical protein